MKFGRIPNDFIRQRIRDGAETVTVTRPDDSKDSRFGESRGVDTNHSVDIWFFNPTETPVDTDYGTREVGDLSGLALPSVDIEVHDQITRGSEVYEVLSNPKNVPNSTNPNHVLIQLGRITNTR